MTSDLGFTCPCDGGQHPELTMNHTAGAPAVWDPAFGDARDCLPSSDRCVVREQHYFAHLKTHVHTRPVGERSFLELEPAGHPLAVELRTEMTPARVPEVAFVLHSGVGSQQ